MRRREFIAGLGSAAGWPLAAHAQQATMPVIGYLSNTSADSSHQQLRAFSDGLNLLGFVEGRNVAVIYRWAESQNERLPALAADLVRRQVAVIVAVGTQSVQAAKAATTSIPIVFVVGGNPVEGGMAPSLNRPAGNITGVTLFDVEVAGKLVEFMHELVPTAPTLAFLTNPTNQGTAVSETKALKAAAGALGVELLILHATRSAEIEGIYASLAGQSVGGLIVSGDNLFFMLRDKLFALAEKYKVPAIYHYPEHAQAGGLMGYGAKTTDMSRTVGIYVGRILRGEKPADLPIQQATKIELVINLKTANTLGITFPPTLLVRADEVIE
jgi:putative tryptophan/tyrosine transport system substrate-binding protein